jgi:protein gp37
MAKRLKAMGQQNYAQGFQVSMHEHTLDMPSKLRAPQRLFVNSMSDLFHDAVPTAFIQRVFDTMNGANWHQYQILTKRSARLRDLDGVLPWAEHIWMGVSVENAKCLGRIDDLRASRAFVKFLSLEPLLGPLPDLDLAGIDWVIVGGESGPGARPVKAEWVTGIRDQCLAAEVPFFFKQWGGVRKKSAGRSLEGRTWDQMPSKGAKGQVGLAL